MYRAFSLPMLLIGLFMYVKNAAEAASAPTEEAAQAAYDRKCIGATVITAGFMTLVAH